MGEDMNAHFSCLLIIFTQESVIHSKSWQITLPYIHRRLALNRANKSPRSGEFWRWTERAKRREGEKMGALHNESPINAYLSFHYRTATQGLDLDRAIQPEPLESLSACYSLQLNFAQTASMQILCLTLRRRAVAAPRSRLV